MTVTALHDALAEAVGPDGLAPGDLARFAVDGVPPKAVAAPDSVDAASALLRLANDSGLAVVPRGGGVSMAAGMPPDRLDVVLETRRLNALTLHEPADLVAGAQAGMTLEALNRALAEHGQMLPLDAPNPGRATLGGILSADVAGPRRGFYGTARDRVIGLQAIDPAGTPIKGGGRVVKNVAGYDLPKLFIGAHGTLGLISEVTFKLAPLPPARTAIIGAFAKIGPALDAALAILKSGLRPTALDLLNGAAYRAAAMRVQMPSISDRDYFLAAELAGVPGAVERQKMQVHRAITAAGGKSLLADEASQQDGFWRAVIDLGRTAQRPATMITRFSTRWDGLEKLVLGHEALAESNEAEAAIEVYLGVGLGRTAWWVGESPPPEPAKLAAIIVTLRKAAEIAGGPFVVESVPPAVKKLVDVWGTPGPEFDIMRRIKDLFDPNEVMSPGRFLGGL